MSSQPSPLIGLLSEIFPIIAAHLPLHSTPSALLSLALVNHHISEIVLPLLYSRLVLKNETDALNVIQRLLDNPELGQGVREIHILSNLSLATRTGVNPFDVVTGLENLIKAGSLPYIHTLGLHLLTGWHYDDHFQAVEGFGKLRSDFWINLKKNCPRLRGLVIKDIADDEEDPWVNDCGLFDIQDLTSFTLIFKHYTLTQAGCDKLLKNINSLSANLHTLDLTPSCNDYTSVSSLFAVTFPKLRSLNLASFIVDNPAQTMDFWERHPSLESVRILSEPDEAHWFSSNLPEQFLPNLKHLKAHFYDVLKLAPILNQLASLAITGSINAQIPYLLRSVLPNGLPNLKSLDIDQCPSNSGKNNNIEGALWYETEHGVFRKAKVTKAERSVLDGYIHSIVRGAPNLEEIGFNARTKGLEDFANIASEFAGFSKLRRLYHDGPGDGLTDEAPEVIISNATILAEACAGLAMIVNMNRVNLPYVAARISRTESGEVRSVEVGSGYGMQIGNEDDPFPVKFTD